MDKRQQSQGPAEPRANKRAKANSVAEFDWNEEFPKQCPLTGASRDLVPLRSKHHLCPILVSKVEAKFWVDVFSHIDIAEYVTMARNDSDFKAKVAEARANQAKPSQMQFKPSEVTGGHFTVWKVKSKATVMNDTEYKHEMDKVPIQRDLGKVPTQMLPAVDNCQELEKNYLWQFNPHATHLRSFSITHAYKIMHMQRGLNYGDNFYESQGEDVYSGWRQKHEDELVSIPKKKSAKSENVDPVRSALSLPDLDEFRVKHGLDPYAPPGAGCTESSSKRQPQDTTCGSTVAPCNFPFAPAQPSSTNGGQSVCETESSPILERTGSLDNFEVQSLCGVEVRSSPGGKAQPCTASVASYSSDALDASFDKNDDRKVREFMLKIKPSLKDLTVPSKGGDPAEYWCQWLDVPLAIITGKLGVQRFQAKECVKRLEAKQDQKSKAACKKIRAQLAVFAHGEKLYKDVALTLTDKDFGISLREVNQFLQGVIPFELQVTCLLCALKRLRPAVSDKQIIQKYLCAGMGWPEDAKKDDEEFDVFDPKNRALPNLVTRLSVTTDHIVGDWFAGLCESIQGNDFLWQATESLGEYVEKVLGNGKQYSPNENMILADIASTTRGLKIYIYPERFSVEDFEELEHDVEPLYSPQPASSKHEVLKLISDAVRVDQSVQGTIQKLKDSFAAFVWQADYVKDRGNFVAKLEAEDLLQTCGVECMGQLLDENITLLEDATKLTHGIDPLWVRAFDQKFCDATINLIGQVHSREDLASCAEKVQGMFPKLHKVFPLNGPISELQAKMESMQMSKANSSKVSAYVDGVETFLASKSLEPEAYRGLAAKCEKLAGISLTDSQANLAKEAVVAINEGCLGSPLPGGLLGLVNVVFALVKALPVAQQSQDLRPFQLAQKRFDLQSLTQEVQQSCHRDEDDTELDDAKLTAAAGTLVPQLSTKIKSITEMFEVDDTQDNTNLLKHIQIAKSEVANATGLLVRLKPAYFEHIKVGLDKAWEPLELIYKGLADGRDWYDTLGPKKQETAWKTFYKNSQNSLLKDEVAAACDLKPKLADFDKILDEARVAVVRYHGQDLLNLKLMQDRRDRGWVTYCESIALTGFKTSPERAQLRDVVQTLEVVLNSAFPDGQGLNMLAPTLADRCEKAKLLKVPTEM